MAQRNRKHMWVNAYSQHTHDLDEVYALDHELCGSCKGQIERKGNVWSAHVFTGRFGEEEIAETKKTTERSVAKRFIEAFHHLPRTPLPPNN